MNIGELVTQVKVLHQECDQQIEVIRKIYDSALAAKVLPVELQPKIKNILENQRSILEYIAHFTVENFGTSGSKSQYPLAPVVASIPTSISTSLRGVTEVELVEFFSKRQPCLPDYSWLLPLIEETNSFKHRKFVAQSRTEQEWITARGESGAVSWDPKSVKFGEGVQILGSAVDPRTQLPVGGNVTREILIGWNFEGTDTNVLGAIFAIQKGLFDLFEEFTSLIASRF